MLYSYGFSSQCPGAHLISIRTCRTPSIRASIRPAYLLQNRRARPWRSQRSSGSRRHGNHPEKFPLCRSAAHSSGPQRGARKASSGSRTLCISDAEWLTWPYHLGSTRHKSGMAIRAPLRLEGTSHHPPARASPYTANCRNADGPGQWLCGRPPKDPSARNCPLTDGSLE